MKEELLKKVKRIVQPEYNKLTNWEHGWLHITDVERKSNELAKAEKADPVLCRITAYCHDLGRIPEEQNFIDNSLEGSRDHARLSIEPTAKILNDLGITGVPFGYIVEAVTVHSYLQYEGKNIVAKILRDSDKGGAFGPLGLLRLVKFHIGKDFINTKEIINNYDDPQRINKLADKTLELIKKDPLVTKKVSETGLAKVLEWVENKMFHSELVYSLFAEDIQYIQKAKEFLSS